MKLEQNVIIILFELPIILKAMVANLFNKKCATCGSIYRTYTDSNSNFWPK